MSERPVYVLDFCRGIPNASKETVPVGEVRAGWGIGLEFNDISRNCFSVHGSWLIWQRFFSREKDESKINLQELKMLLFNTLKKVQWLSYPFIYCLMPWLHLHVKAIPSSHVRQFSWDWVGWGYLVAVTGSTGLLRDLPGCYRAYVLLIFLLQKSPCMAFTGQIYGMVWPRHEPLSAAQFWYTVGPCLSRNLYYQAMILLCRL